MRWQVHVVFCDWLAWLLRMKVIEHDASLESVLDVRHETNNHSNDLVTFTRHHHDADDSPSIHDTQLTCTDVVRFTDVLICVRILFFFLFCILSLL